ncbi:MAG: nucleotidyltransferase domain-containing protein [Syntrophomonadaceae bacterium]|nr:nucleotidyltransferase domain-containing protein [Syntrophomonadaceae bacterium]
MDSQLEDNLKAFINEIDQEYPIELAYLFGSYARGTENSQSDIDIALLFKHQYTNYEELLIRGQIIDKGMSVFSRPVDVVSLNSAPPLLKYEVVVNSVILKDSELRSSFESLAIREYFDFQYYSRIYNEAVIGRIRDDDYFIKKVE